MITDEMVVKATRAYGVPSDDDWNYERIRAALEAVAPMLIAQGLREASEIVDGVKILRVQDDVSAEVNIDMALKCASDAIRNRAQELDPK